MSAGVHRGQTRVSGHTVATEVADAEAQELLDSIDEDALDIDRTRTFSSLSFSRMRTAWRPEEAAALGRMHEAVRDTLFERFSDAYRLMYEVYDTVREPEVDQETGEVAVDGHGMPLWRQSPSGGYIEDWTRLTQRQKEHFLFGITTNLFAWQQEAADLWGEAMMSKALWQETFSHHFEQPERGTVDSRTARGNTGSAEDRYFAVYVSLLSRKADALTRSMELLAQRLKDVLER